LFIEFYPKFIPALPGNTISSPITISFELFKFFWTVDIPSPVPVNVMVRRAVEKAGRI
jgi:hypothetical protein